MRIVLLTLLLVATGACASHSHGAPAGHGADGQAHDGPGHVAPPALKPATADRLLGTEQAPVYDKALVPDGARVVVVAVATGDGNTHTVLLASGLRPHHDYGVHVHVQPCGPDPAAAGPHFQHRVDPNQPSSDLSFLNPRNEIWLDFTSDTTGAGKGSSTVLWQFSDRRAKSVVLHDGLTDVHAAHTSGPPRRLACVNVDF